MLSRVVWKVMGSSVLAMTAASTGVAALAAALSPSVSTQDAPLELMLTRVLASLPSPEATLRDAPTSAGVPLDRIAADASLDTLIAQAMSTSPLLGARRSDVSAARHEVDAARWQYAPSFSTQLQKGSGSADQYGSAVRADQPLWSGGRLTADLDAATARSKSARFGVQETGLSVALQVVSAYQSVQAAQAQTAAILAYRDRLSSLQATLARRIDSGVSPATESALMSARIAQAQNDLLAAEAAEDAAAATLRQLVGDEVRVASARHDAPNVAPALPAMCQPNAEADVLIETSIDRNPAVRRTLEDVEAARGNARSQRAALSPNVVLRVEQPVGHVAENLSKSTRVSVLLSYTPNAGLSTLSRASAGDDRVAGLQNQLQALRRELAQQIRAECAQQAGLGQRAAGYVHARAYTGDVLASYMRLFVAGKRGWLDVLNAAREDFENEQAGAVAAASLFASQYRLRLLSGDYELGTMGLPAADAPSTSHPLIEALKGMRS